MTTSDNSTHLVPTSSPTSSQGTPGHQRDDLVPQSPSPSEGDEVSEPPRPRPGTASPPRDEHPHDGSDPMASAEVEQPHEEAFTSVVVTCPGCVVLEAVRERDEARVNRDRLAHQLAGARAELHEAREALREEIRGTHLHHSDLPGLLRAAEVIGVPPGDADSTEGGGRA